MYCRVPARILLAFSTVPVMETAAETPAPNCASSLVGNATVAILKSPSWAIQENLFATLLALTPTTHMRHRAAATANFMVTDVGCGGVVGAGDLRVGVCVPALCPCTVGETRNSRLAACASSQFFGGGDGSPLIKF